MFGHQNNFFSFPQIAKTSKRLANFLALAVCVETTVEVMLAVSEGGLMPAILIPYVPIAIGVLTGIQSDLLLEGNELKANAKRFSNWFDTKLRKPVLIETDLERPDINNSEVNTKNKCLVNMEKAYLAIAIPTILTSLPIVPAAKFFLAYYQMQQLLTDKLLFALPEEDPSVIAACVISGIFSAYYSGGTEGSSAIYWLNDNSKIKYSCCPSLITHCFSKPAAAVAGRDKSIVLPAALLGAINYSFLQGLSAYQLLKSKVDLSSIFAGCIAGFLFLDMTLQNFTFQGREFRKSAQGLHAYLNGEVILDPEDYEEINKPSLKRWQKNVLLTFNTIMIALPTFFANYALTSFTITSGFQDYFHDKELKNWQINCGIVGGAIAAIGELLTETVSAMDEIEEIISHRFIKR